MGALLKQIGTDPLHHIHDLSIQNVFGIMYNDNILNTNLDFILIYFSDGWFSHMCAFSFHIKHLNFSCITWFHTLKYCKLVLKSNPEDHFFPQNIFDKKIAVLNVLLTNKFCLATWTRSKVSNVSLKNSPIETTNL